MVQFEYRGYGGHVPQKPDGLMELLARMSYSASFAYFTILLAPFVEGFYASYEGENDLFGENGRINTEGKLTKHLWNRYKTALDQVNASYLGTKPDNLPIKRYLLLPDLSFAAELRDGTVMVEVDRA